MGFSDRMQPLFGYGRGDVMPTPHNTANTGDIAKTVIMPGDPLRAKYIADTYLDNVVRFNNVRNIYGYTGVYRDVDISVMASGMGMPSMGIIKKEVYDGQKAHFYTKSTIGNENYFSYYCPLFDENDQCVGMVFAGKASDYVNSIVWKSILPILLLVLLSMIILIFVIWNYADHLNRAFRQLQRFLGNVEEGDFTVELSESLTKRKDEIGQMAGTAVRMQHSLRDLVQRDSLTGLYNRHYGEIWMKQVKEEARDTGEPFSIAIADIDFFKKFNDCYGHDCGDMVLRKVSELLQTQVGRQGYVSRWGGEEFLIIFKRFTLEESVKFAEEIREKLHRTELRYQNECFHVTMTIGVAAGDSEKSIESMVKCADCALYAGKEGGRDRVVCEKQKQSV